MSKTLPKIPIKKSLPKLILKVDLLDVCRVKITHMKSVYTGETVVNGSRVFRANNGWMITSGSGFSINKARIITIPKHDNQIETIISFSSNTSRKQFLKTLALSLTEYSSTDFYNRKNETEEVIYNKNLWVLF